MKFHLIKILFSCILCLSFFIISSCKNQTSGNPSDNIAAQSTTAVKSDTVTNCYTLNENKDINAISLTISANDVKGYMAWEPFEKDGAHGSITGKKDGNIITGNLMYMIEGSTQNEQVIFKLDGDNLAKGQTELEDKNNDGNLTIKDKTKVDYTKEVYKKADCKSVEGPIKNAKEVCDQMMKESQAK